MNYMKKITALCLALLLLCLPLCACGTKKNEARVTVVCTVFPIYDWVRNIVGETDGVRVLWLADNGSDLHSYQPSAEDMIDIATADLTVFVGGASDSWVRDAVKNSSSGEGMALSEIDGVTLRAVSRESGHTHDGEEESDHHHETDEHLWLSLKNAAAAVRAICEKLCELDESCAETYRLNADRYLAQINAWDQRYSELNASSLYLIFADRFPFVYLTEDYGMEYQAAFSGCTTDTDADFSTVIRLAEAADRHQARCILVTESSDQSLAQSVIRATQSKNQTVAVMNSLQSVTAAQCADGVTYLSVMEENFETLRQIANAEIKE